MLAKWNSLGAKIRSGGDPTDAIRARCALMTATDEVLKRPYRIDHERLEHAVAVLVAARAALGAKPLVLSLVVIDAASLAMIPGAELDASLLPLIAGATPECAALRLVCADASTRTGVVLSTGPYTPEAPGEWARWVWEKWADSVE